MRKLLFALVFAVVAFGATRIETAPAQKTDRIYAGSFLAIGYLPPSHRYVVDAPIEGVVERLPLKLFESVKKGELLAVIKSPKILEIEADLIDAIIERDYYRSEVRRLEPLYKAAVVAKKVYLKAKNDLAKYQTKVEFLKNLLIDWGLGKDMVARVVRTKRPYPYVRITAPISGKVADLAIYPKLYLERGEHMLTIVDPSLVYTQVALPLSVAAILKEGQVVYVDEKEARIKSIAPAVDELTQTVAVLLDGGVRLLPNQKRNVTLKLTGEALVVPASAVVDIEGQSGVFVKRGERFEFVPVQILSRTEKEVYILPGALKAGDEVAITGVISLKGAWEAADDR